MRALIVFLLLLSAGDAANDEPLSVRKCCRKGQMFEAKGTSCISREGVRVEYIEHEVLEPPISGPHSYWLPDFLRNRLLDVYYNVNFRMYYSSTAMQVSEYMIEKLLINRTYDLSLFQGRVQRFMVGSQDLCLEATEDPKRPFVFVTWLYLMTVKKCCAWDERLDAEAEHCEHLPDRHFGPTLGAEERILDTFQHPNDSYWLPMDFRNSTIKVVSSQFVHKPNVLLDARKEGRSWFVTNSWPMAVWVRGGSRQFQGITEYFCFEAVAPGALPSPVLLAFVVNISKCCLKGEQSDATAANCVQHPAHDMENITYEEIDLKLPNSSAYWVPKQIRKDKNRISVAYNGIPLYYLLTAHKHVFSSDDDNWRIEYPTFKTPTLALNVSTPSGQKRVVRTDNFCFEAVADSTTPHPVIVTTEIPGLQSLPKCCLLRHRLSPHGYCEGSNETDWSPLNSSVTQFLQSNVPYISRLIDLNFCMTIPYTILKDYSPQKFVNESSNHGYDGTLYCADLQRTSDGSVREVFAACEWPPSAPLYKKVRPLHVGAAVLLAAAIAVLLAREDTRRSTHGQALACHAACLMAANSLQAYWFFTYQSEGDCRYIGYSIYFFLVAGAFWLNAVAVNMARGFRRPLGAMARGGGGKGWWRLALLSAYAWGSAAALTTFAIYMHLHGKRVYGWQLIQPSFFETRTCTKETFNYVDYYPDQISGYSDEINQRYEVLASLLYYYVPCMILVVANAVCLAAAFCRIRELRKDSALLQTTSRPLQTALLYVKLLLMAGILEVTVEATLWATRRRKYDNILESAIYSVETSYVFAIVSNFVDLGRALLVLWLSVGRSASQCCSKSEVTSPVAVSATAGRRNSSFRFRSKKSSAKGRHT